MTPLVQAEQALLGAVLLEPSQLEKLTPWLQPSHFYRPAHQALFAAALKLHADRHPAVGLAVGESVPLAWLSDTVAVAGTQTRGITSSYAHLLVSACPRPEHAVIYGRMVLEGAIHRAVAQHATRLHQAARADAVRGGTEETIRQADILTEALGDLSRRWGTDARPAPASPSAVPPGPVPKEYDEHLLADEEFLLACLSTRPEQLGDVVGWLHPADFTDAGHQQIYQSLGALHHRGEPIDQLTVLWEVQRRGALSDRTLEADRVMRICDGSSFGGSAEHYGERLVRASLLRTAADAAGRVRTLSDDESLAAGSLINHALDALGPLDQVRRRWKAATGAGPGPVQPTRTTAATSPQRADAALTRSRPTRSAGAQSATPAHHPTSPPRGSRRSPS
ncbi:DnaB-like helicase N-terminal domain-containing protein [Streptomyces sp. G1]|uniref:DnaB-like helicase N-terminal domain-containing protein n=1 Tax=Streptomyces sp. G1 TaxID=361572 RepID=UPI00202F7F91|nr:DnaB-like helicase N-terminal domain-containing protein [Streptomyces sp. G1]MCM1967974.1 helicase DnaB [Streptomyces sp. G1]